MILATLCVCRFQYNFRGFLFALRMAEGVRAVMECPPLLRSPIALWLPRLSRIARSYLHDQGLEQLISRRIGEKPKTSKAYERSSQPPPLHRPGRLLPREPMFGTCRTISVDHIPLSLGYLLQHIYT
jgi:hypothetical protein